MKNSRITYLFLLSTTRETATTDQYAITLYASPTQKTDSIHCPTDALPYLYPKVNTKPATPKVLSFTLAKLITEFALFAGV